MKKREFLLSKIVVAFVLGLLIMGAVAPGSANAASQKTKNIKKLVSQMNAYEANVLFDSGMDVGDSSEVKLNSRAKMIAAAFSPSVKVLDTIQYGDEETTPWFDIYYESILSEKNIKTAAKNMFGKSYDKSVYPKYTGNEMSWVGMIFNHDGKIVTLWSDIEDENLFEVRKVSVKGNTVVKDVYSGYWGCGMDGVSSNYRITYTVKKNSKSKYGYVISSMKIEKTANEFEFSMGYDN